MPYRRIAPLILALLMLAAAHSAWAASYRGRNVDDRRYRGSVLNNDFGSIPDCELKFQGDHVFVNVNGGGRLVLILEDEEITDPHAVYGYDPRRGVTWELDIKDMNVR